MVMRLTISKFQQLYEISSQDINELDKATRLAMCLTGKTEDQVDSMSPVRFNALCRSITNLFDFEAMSIDRGKPVDYIKANGRTYRIIYDVSRKPFNAGKYVEVATFSKDVVGNLHKIMASIVQPMGWSWRKFGMVPVDREHQDIADDMLDADFKACYHAMVFFYAVFNDSMRVLRHYLEKEMTREIDQEAAVGILEGLSKHLDGFTMPKWYRSLRASRLEVYGI